MNAIAGEDREREQDVHRDARDEDEHLGDPALGRERARVVGAVAVLALELHEAADRQPVERVDGLALVAQDLGPRREADAELQHADVREPGGDEVAELVDDHEGAQDEDEQDDRDDRLHESGHACPSDGAGRERGPDLGVERDELVEVRAGVAGGPAEPLDGRLEQAGDAREVERPVEEPGDGDVVGGDQRGRRARARPAGLTGDAQRREPRLVGRAEVQPRRRR